MFQFLSVHQPNNDLLQYLLNNFLQYYNLIVLNCYLLKEILSLWDNTLIFLYKKCQCFNEQFISVSI